MIPAVTSRVHLQGDERPAVLRPAHDLRQLGDARAAVEDRRAAATLLRERVKRGAEGGEMAERVLGGGHRVVLQARERLHGLEGIAEHEARALERAEEVRHGREARSLHVLEEERRAAGGVDAPVDSGHLQVRVHLLADADEMAVALEVADTGGKTRVTQRSTPGRVGVLAESDRFGPGRGLGELAVRRNRCLVGAADCRGRHRHAGSGAPWGSRLGGAGAAPGASAGAAGVPAEAAFCRKR